MGGGAPKKGEPKKIPSMATEKKSTFKGSAGIKDGGEVGLGDDERVGDELIYTKAKTLDELETAICAADENRLTIVHFVQIDKTGKEETEGSSELMTLLQNSRGVGSYIIVDDPRICVRLAVTYVPHFVLFRGREKLDDCSGLDLSLLRTSITLNDKAASATPFKGERNGVYPLADGTPCFIYT